MFNKENNRREFVPAPVALYAVYTSESDGVVFCRPIVGLYATYKDGAVSVVPADIDENGNINEIGHAGHRVEVTTHRVPNTL